MPNEVTTSSSTTSRNYTLNYAAKYRCTHCGFEDDLCAGYECPICRKGTMCRVTRNTTTWTALGLWGFYGPAIDSASSPPMEDGYLFVRR